MTHNFLQSNGVTVRNCITCEETQIARHVEGKTGYFVEMLDHVFCSVGGQHFVILDDFHLQLVDLPKIDGFALEPRCVDTARRRMYFDTEKICYCVSLDEEFRVTGRWQYGSAGVTPDHHLHILNNHVFALRLGQPALVLDEVTAKFMPVKDYLKCYQEFDMRIEDSLEPSPNPRNLWAAEPLPNISGIIYKIFDLDTATFMIVTEAVELTQARLRISETESDPRVVGIFEWNSKERCWRDVSALTSIPRSQIQQAIILNHPGVPIYSRRPCYD